MAYYGDPKGVVDHFAAIGLQCAPQYNPADFVCELLLVMKNFGSVKHVVIFRKNFFGEEGVIFALPVEAVRMEADVKRNIFEAARSSRFG